MCVVQGADCGIIDRGDVDSLGLQGWQNNSLKFLLKKKVNCYFISVISYTYTVPPLSAHDYIISPTQRLMETRVKIKLYYYHVSVHVLIMCSVYIPLYTDIVSGL